MTDTPAAQIPDPHFLAQELNAWFGVHGRDLLWRHPDTTPYGVLVSEIMSQQTPVRRVEPMWQAWMTRWPTPTDLAAATPADVIRQWANLGYPRRALRLQECAQVCVEKHNGDIPIAISDLEALPGVGSYTARAVAAFAFGQAVPVVDTNVRRVYRRVVDGEFLQGPARSRDVRDVARLLPYVDNDPSLSRRHRGLPDFPPLPLGDPKFKDAANLMCASLMELGALICTATNPACERCPIATHCRWLALGKPRPNEEQQAAAKKRVQKFAGTDRQVRGKILAALRGISGETAPTAVSALGESDIMSLWDDKLQLSRCLDSLLVDGLIEKTESDGARSYHLPL
ncbi:A/G-specific adenine glycosylase [Corynebacterium anserum]|uniref:Adenine DNA glycosylase n=1 Tax=Corynebacterium anserum TaxID=2684406 RepID=A0A7G7YM34_9CORY|nr:A/G-specific adenine glycosylase [Corynebacterium anserum]MBC2681266.1 A/G-specific adenine glycosylase [Corynebacterium anserum]QNH95554.1 A/G-specific adenine glycosylase [Corynebacterium anserum]